MIYSLTQIQNIYSELSDIFAATVEHQLDLYSYGSISHVEQYGNMIKYIELYLFDLNCIIEMLESSIDYTNYSFTDEGIMYLINKCNEIIFYNK